MAEQKSDLSKLTISMMKIFLMEKQLETSQNRDENARAASKALLRRRVKKLIRAIPRDISRDKRLKKYYKSDDSDDSSDEAPDDESGDPKNSTAKLEDRYKPPNDLKFETAGKVMEIAEDYLTEQKHDLAAQTYSRVAQYVIGQDYPFTLRDDNRRGVESPRYHALSKELRHIVVACCYGLSYCVFKPEQYNLNSGLAWLYEAEIVVRNWRYDRRSTRMHDRVEFSGFMLPIPTALSYFNCLIRRAEIFKTLDNSSAYQHTLMMAAHNLFTLHRHNESGETIKTLSDLMDGCIAQMKPHAEAMYSGRHPDPDSNHRYSIVVPSLQIRGAWKKMSIGTEDIIRGKLDYSPFIWRGYLYVARAGMPELFNASDPAQLRRLNLKRRDKWEFVTTFPSARGESAFNCLCVKGNTMYAFTGRSSLDVLNLTTNTWSALRTTWKPTPNDRRAGIDPVWPWPGNVCVDAIQELVDDQLFVFGGINRLSAKGCNLLMKLDLKTLEWRRLSGFPWVTLDGDPFLPGPRVSCGSWVSKDKKMYIFSGVFHNMLKPKDGLPVYWTYDDLWSWDIRAEKWREEKMQGNCPSPRSGMGYVFSEKLNKVVVFGGTNRTCINIIGESSEERCSANFYADTFIWNPLEVQGDTSSGGKTVTAHWQQVQTVGFPTYRMECYLVVDPDTGDIYLYGGHVQADSLPSKNHTEVERRKRRTYETPLAQSIASSPLLAEVARTFGGEELGRKTFTQQFGDLWKLHLDIPGGDFECINMEDEMRTALLGPWQRCFECRKAGFWKKCSGSCNGKAFFCDVDCQKKGWKSHKEFHGCRKLQNSTGTK